MTPCRSTQDIQDMLNAGDIIPRRSDVDDDIPFHPDDTNSHLGECLTTLFSSKVVGPPLLLFLLHCSVLVYLLKSFSP